MKAIYALIVWSLMIIILSVLPVSEDRMSIFEHEDKVVHFVLYAIHCVLLIACLNNYQNRKYAIAIIVSILFGVAMEFTQGVLNTERHFDYFDIIANISGSFIGSFLFYLLPKKIQDG